MNNAICFLLMTSFLVATDYGYKGSTTAAVSLVGGIIKTKHSDTEKKYPRKNCPVCKGTGKYLSGDGIKMVDCGYCEPETKNDESIQDKTKSPFCKCEDCRCSDCKCKPKSQ